MITQQQKRRRTVVRRRQSSSGILDTTIGRTIHAHMHTQRMRDGESGEIHLTKSLWIRAFFFRLALLWAPTSIRHERAGRRQPLQCVEIKCAGVSAGDGVRIHVCITRKSQLILIPSAFDSVSCVCAQGTARNTFYSLCHRTEERAAGVSLNRVPSVSFSLHPHDGMCTHNFSSLYKKKKRKNAESIFK